MGRKRLITDSYPVVKRREGPAGHSKGELATELGLWGVGRAEEWTRRDMGRGRMWAMQGEVKYVLYFLHQAWQQKTEAGGGEG